MKIYLQNLRNLLKFKFEIVKLCKHISYMINFICMYDKITFINELEFNVHNTF